MLIVPTTLSLIVTHHCTAACEHCCFGCSPQIPKSTRIPKERIASLIDETADIASLSIVVFTGGECFTLGKELDEHVARATSYGKIARTVTNGYWAKTADGAKRRVEAIMNAGLKEINFSSGTYHGKYVPFKSVKNGVAAAVEAGLVTVLNVESCDQSEDVSELTEDEDILRWATEGRLMLNRNTWIEAGGQSELTHPEAHSRFHPANMGGCKTVLTTLTVTPAQSLVACCGLHLERIPELHLGSVANQSIVDLLKSRKDDLLKVWIHLDGPEVILTLARERDPSIKLPLSSTHPCETCLFLYKEPALRKAVLELVQEKRADIMRRYTEAITLNLHALNILAPDANRQTVAIASAAV